MTPVASLQASLAAGGLASPPVGPLSAALTPTRWFRAGHADYQDSSALTPAGDGDVVGYVRSLAGAGSGSQAVSASKPTLVASAVNGRAAWSFDGADDTLAIGPLGLTASLTVYVLFKKSGQLTAASSCPVGNNPLSSGIAPFWWANPSATWRLLASGRGVDILAGTPTTSWTLLTVSYLAATRATLWAGSTLVGTDSTGVGTLGDADWSLGQGGGDNYRWEGMIAEAAFFAAEHDANARRVMWDYFADRYALVIP